MPRMFMKQTIKKETIALGVAGQIKRDDGFPELPPRARVTFKATADYETIKHKFLEKGGVEEMLILTIQPGTFEVLDVAEAPKQEELGLDGQQPEESVAVG